MDTNKIQKYCEDVCSQIRWAKAKPYVSKEIENHICDQRDYYMVAGDEEEIATIKAIEQMGDPISIGEDLDKTHKPKPQYLMMVLFDILMIAGVYLNQYLSVINPETDFSVALYLVTIAIFQICYLVDFTILGKFPKSIYFGGVLFGIYLTMLSPNINALDIFNFGFNCLYLLFPLFYALFIYAMRNKGFKGIIFCGLAFLPIVQILGLQGTISGIFFCALISLIVLCYAICKGWFGVDKKGGLAIVLTPTLLISGLFIRSFTNGFRGHRLIAFIDPNAYKNSGGYLYYNLRENLNGATLFGQGVLPPSVEMNSEWWSDFLLRDNFNLAYFINQFGIYTLILVVLIFGILCVLGVRKALKEQSMLGTLIALTIILAFSIQALFYVLGNIGYGMYFSFSLPFIFGSNEALIINSALMGFMLSIFRTGEVFSDLRNIKSVAQNKVFYFEDGKLTINFK